MSLHSIFGDTLAQADDAAFERLRCLSEGLVNGIGVAHALAESGRRVDLSAFADPIGRLCAGALDLSPAAGRKARLLLLGVLGALDRAAVALRPLEDAETSAAL